MLGYYLIVGYNIVNTFSTNLSIFPDSISIVLGLTDVCIKKESGASILKTCARYRGEGGGQETRRGQWRCEIYFETKKGLLGDFTF